MSEDWEKLEGGKAETVLEEINAHVTPAPFDVANTMVRRKDLPFFPGYALVELADLSDPQNLRKYALYKPGNVHMITWTNEVIYTLNETAPLALDDNRVLDYVKFFFAHVRGRHGQFLIVESADDIKWREEPPPQGRRALQDLLKPVSVTGTENDGSYILTAYMVFRDSLFRTKIRVNDQGIINLFDEELMIEDMPVIEDTPGV